MSLVAANGGKSQCSGPCFGNEIGNIGILINGLYELQCVADEEIPAVGFPVTPSEGALSLSLGNSLSTSGGGCRGGGDEDFVGS